MSPRSKRAAATINFAKFDTETSDDDFVDSTPPVEKKKEKISKRNSNKSKAAESTTVAGPSTHDGKNTRKNPKEKFTSDEEKYQEELNKVLALSAQEVKGSFDGFNSNTDNEEQPVTTDLFSPIAEQTVKVEVHSPPADKRVLSVDLERTEIAVDNPLPTPLPQAVQTNNTRCRKMRVKFAEDSEESFDESNSESSDSDCYSPSPPRKKLKQSKKSVTQSAKSKDKSTTKKPLQVKQKQEVKRGLKDYKTMSNNTSVNLNNDKIVDVSTKECVVGVTECVKNDEILSLNRYDNKIESSSIDKILSLPGSTYSKSVENSKTTVGSVASRAPTSPYNSFVTPFKSPSSNSAGSSSGTKQSIGLRLGLSRRSITKPLHPNAVVK